MPVILRSEPHNFNPRPREEGDGKHSGIECQCDISIHALVKRATDSTEYCSELSLISIHALVKRATQRADDGLDRNTISIHALVKRATIFVPLPETDLLFQSTPS